MSFRALRVVPLAACLLLSACGKEIGRVPLSGDGSGESSFTMAAGELRFWTDLDVAFDGDAEAYYRVTILRDGKKLAETDCNPFGPIRAKLSWVETNVGDHHTRRGLGRMECSISLDPGGRVDLRATLRFERKPKNLALKKADLVVRQ